MAHAIIPLQCRCGSLRGTLDVVSGNGVHVVCYCDDCQAYAHALGRDDVLDAHGGTDIWQSTPASLKITQGLEQVRCLRLSDKGMLRWHTACCSTPIGNSMASAKVPFIGVVHSIMDDKERRRDDVIGPATGVQARFAIGGAPAGAHATASLGLIVRSIAFLLRGFVTRAHKPTPFFDDAGQPCVTPRVLSDADRAALRAKPA